MRRFTCLAALLLVHLSAPPTQAQCFVPGYGYQWGPGLRFADGAFFNTGVWLGPGLNLRFFANVQAFSYYRVFPTIYPTYFSPFAAPIVNPYFVPTFGGPIVNPIFPAPLLVDRRPAPAAAPVAPRQADDDIILPGPRQNFLVFRPREGKNNEAVANNAPAAVPAPEQMPGQVVGGFRPARVPAEIEVARADDPFRPPAPAAAPIEAILQRGLDAFRAEAYGRALQAFEQGIRTAPQDARAYFLKAQTQFALGRWHDATASIVAGLERDPHWANRPFRVRDLYAQPVTYQLQVQALSDAQSRDPENPTLLFLLGVQYRLDGRNEDGRLLLEKARQRTTQPAAIDRFLNADTATVQRG